MALSRPTAPPYDEARRDHHAQLPLVTTPTIRQLLNTGRRLIQLNRGQVSARRGLILSGAAGTGKTTAITQLGKHPRARDPQRHPGPAGTGSRSSTSPSRPPRPPRMLAVEFARFLGLPSSPAGPTSPTSSTPSARPPPAPASSSCWSTRSTTSTSPPAPAPRSPTQLKYFAERIPATFVYAGIDVERAGPVRRHPRPADRRPVHPDPTGPFAYGTAEQREMAALVATLEASCACTATAPAPWSASTDYLHQRTGGMIGSLSHLIRGAAIQAIDDGTEQITRTPARQRPGRPRRRNAPTPPRPTAPRTAGRPQARCG